MQSYIIALLILLSWSLFAVLAKRFWSDKLEQRGMTFWGPILMVRTERGKRLIDRIASRKRFWTIFGDASIVIVIASMVSMFLLLIWTATRVLSIPAEQAPTPQMLIGIPGVNPIIPLWYGIWGLVVAVVIHEFSHGILAVSAKMRLKSLGLVFLAIPLGAFVEPDEEDIKGAERRKRMRVYASGPSSNIILSFACIAVFSLVFMGAITPVSDGAPITYVVDDAPAWEAGLVKGDFIVGMGNTSIMSVADFREAMNDTRAGEEMDILVYNRNTGSRNVTITLGYWEDYDRVYQDMTWYQEENASFGLVVDEDGGDVVVYEVLAHSPGEEYGILEEDVIVSIGGIVVNGLEEYRYILTSLVPGEEVVVSVERHGSTNDIHIVPGAGKGYMGVVPSPMRLDGLASYLNRPLRDADGPGDYFARTMGLISLPFQWLGPDDKLSPFGSIMMDLYVVEGPLAVLPESVFWISANLLYWAFWISLMVGLTNSLPAVPMDGGYLFHDMFTGIFSKRYKDEKKLEKSVDRLAIGLALAVLFLVMWQIVGPRL